MDMLLLNFVVFVVCFVVFVVGFVVDFFLLFLSFYYHQTLT